MDSVNQPDPLADEEFIAKLLARVEMNAFTIADLSAHLGEDKPTPVPVILDDKATKPCLVSFY